MKTKTSIEQRLLLLFRRIQNQDYNGNDTAGDIQREIDTLEWTLGTHDKTATYTGSGQWKKDETHSR